MSQGSIPCVGFEVSQTLSAYSNSKQITCFILQAVLAGMAEWSMASDLRSAGGNSAWVRIPLPALDILETSDMV